MEDKHFLIIIIQFNPLSETQNLPSLENSDKINDDRTLKKTPPENPSHVFLGETKGENCVFPIIEPKKSRFLTIRSNDFSTNEKTSIICLPCSTNPQNNRCNSISIHLSQIV